MTTSPRNLFVLATLSVVAAALPTGAAHAQSITGLTSTGSLYTFAATTPAAGVTIPVTGLTAGDSLVALDYRPVDSQLIGLGYNSAAGTARVYTISASGVAASINANTLTLGTGLTRVTADFNPTANAIRVVTSASGGANNNFRIPTAGTGALAADTPLAPDDATIRATAYSRNTAGGGTSGATTLYEVFGSANFLQSQGSVDFFTSQAGGTSPNTGTHTNVFALNGIAAANVVGFDIFNAAGTSATSQGAGFLATGTNLYNFDLASGTAVSVGTFTGVTLVDFAAVPEPGTLALCGVAGAGLAMAGYRRRRRAV